MLQYDNICFDYSTLQDDLIVIHIQGDFANLIECVFKTEFLSTLNKRYKDKTQKDLKISFNNT